MHFLKKYENIILVLALFLIASLLLSKNLRAEQLRSLLERTTMAVITPVQKGITTTMRTIVMAWDHYIFLANSSMENNELRKKLHEQNFQNNLLLEELKKYRRVENLLSLHPVVKSRFQVSAVVAWDSTNLAQTLAIDKGTKDGVKKGMPVVTHEGLVGRTVTTSGSFSRVLMITDARSGVDAFIQGSRVRCLVVGQNKNRGLIRYLPVDADVEVGDVLISSGLGGIYPKGLRLGTVTSLKRGDSRLFYEAEMTPSANFSRLEEVLVMIGEPAVSNAETPAVSGAEPAKPEQAAQNGAEQPAVSGAEQ